MDNPWFHGPNFLHTPEESWPRQKRINPTEEELKPARCQFSHFAPILDFTRFGSWIKMHRVAAYVLRFVENILRKKTGQPLELGYLTSVELRSAEEALWKTAQGETFPDEIAALSKSKGQPDQRHHTVPKSSIIFTKWPFLDDKGVLRSRGRIGAAPHAPVEAKFPVILPKDHVITFFLLDWFHRRYRHANRETIFNEVRQRFDIPILRRLLDKVKNNCAWCRITKASPKPRPSPDSLYSAIYFHWLGLLRASVSQGWPEQR